MEARRLGRTELNVTPIGFGAFKIGRNEGIKYPSGYALPDEAACARLLNEVLDSGIHYIDTAPAYGLSEERIGAAIAHRRGEFVLSTKVGEEFEQGVSRYDFSAAAIERSLERSLRRLRTGVLDLVLIHAGADDARLLTQSDAVASLLRARQRGWARAIGLSGKTVEAERMALDWADVLMVEYHADDASHAETLAAARERQVGVIVKKGLASGTLEPAGALSFVLRNPAVDSVVVGSLDVAHLRDNIRVARALRGGPARRGAQSSAGDPRL